MHVVFDMDLTLVDKTGMVLRPGVEILLGSLKRHDVQMTLWTNSVRSRTELVVKKHRLDSYFSRIIAREDYVEKGKVSYKDIRKCNGDMLVDDQLILVDYVKFTGRQGFLISPFYGSKLMDNTELERLHRAILPEVEFTIRSAFMDTIRDFMKRDV